MRTDTQNKHNAFSSPFLCVCVCMLVCFVRERMFWARAGLIELLSTVKKERP